MSETPIDIIIPTYDNLHQLQQCVDSILRTKEEYPLRIIIVNNGEFPLEDALPKEVTIINPEGNLGWTGGLKLGVDFSVNPSPYLVFLNDDTYIPDSSISWLRDMVRVLESNPLIGAVGPSSNCVLGSQNIWNPPFVNGWEVPFLIGFCMVVRRDALEEVGGIDTDWVHGDDLDLSLRLRKGGYGLVALLSTFVYHHGFQTGEKVYGGSDKEGGWNSRGQVEDVTLKLIKKHGFLAWWEMFAGGWTTLITEPLIDKEGNLIREMCEGVDPKKVLDIACGAALTIKGSLGIDKKIDGINLNLGLDVKHKHKYDVVIARHILEHLDDPNKRIKEWMELLTKDGRLFLCCPNEELGDTIPMDKTHKHAFSPSYLKFIVEGCGGQVTKMVANTNGISFLLLVE